MDGFISELTVSTSQEFLGTQESAPIAVNHQDVFPFKIEITFLHGKMPQEG